MENQLTMEKLVNLCKQYGFIFSGSEIYGGLANTWDYGPLGAELKNNVKKAIGQRTKSIILPKCSVIPI